MTTGADIARNLTRTIGAAQAALTRLPHAVDSITRGSADGYSGNHRPEPHGSNIADPTAGAAHQRLGSIQTIIGDPLLGQHRPGPATRLDDINELADGARHLLARLHDELTKAGVPPVVTRDLRCVAYLAGRNCDNWRAQGRDDHLCIDCGRIKDSKARTDRRRRAR